ncbi:MAG: valine--pyruvate transaminase [Gammaproteobacteria bacterium]|nr:MAG: valine--pyruvate transaminase [Gammaproteobacteria bacterium]
MSLFGEKFAGESGISLLMKDLGAALAGGDQIMMGGGNPGYVPEIEQALMARLGKLSEDVNLFRRAVGIYDAPQGEAQCIEALADYLSQTYGWPVGPENICLTNGSQTAFFMLFNLLAGPCRDGVHRHILLPVTPEYIGYADAGVHAGTFVARRPRIELIGEQSFKYRLDFDVLGLSDSTGAVCLSRPTNPTGNVITDAELKELARLTEERDIPLLIDGAYGLPFPGLVFGEAQPFYSNNTVLCLSLSKVGLPAIRTGIVIGPEWIVQALGEMNGIMSLAPGSMGAVLVEPMLRDGSLIDLCRTHVQPFYKVRAEQAEARLKGALRGTPCRLHVPEGAMFLWLWMKDCPVPAQVMYERLKQRGVLVVPGHHFFPGLEDDDWTHKQECLRITYSQNPDDVMRGLDIIAEEVVKAYR